MSCRTTSCAAPRLMPIGKGPPLNPICPSSTSDYCMRPCNQGPLNILAKYPITNHQFPQNDYGVSGQANAQCEQTDVQCVQPHSPINVNLNMCPMVRGDRTSVERDLPTEKPPCDEYQFEAIPRLNDADCGLGLKSVRNARCVPINYVEKVCSMVPEQYYTPSPYQLDSLTTYGTFFIPKCCEKRTPFKPITQPSKMEGIIEGPSEYQWAYVPHQVAPYQKPKWAKQEEFQPAEGFVGGVTSYKAAFQQKIGSPAKIRRPKNHFGPIRVPLDDRTTYHTQFTDHCQDKVKSCKPMVVNEGISNYPFHGNSIYKCSYTPPCFTTKTKSYKPNFSYRKLDYGFELDTTYSGSYHPFAFQQCTPVNKRNCYTYKDLKL